MSAWGRWRGRNSPVLEIVDRAYPLMIEAYLPAGLVGLVVAGLVAAGYSTFDSIGIGISSLFVRDVYARFIVKNGTDAHYTKVGRISVPIILALGFVYVPFLGEKGMLLFYLRLAGAIAVPLMTVMLMGVFTRVHRQTGIVGLLVGLGYGMSAILADFNEWALPVWYQNTWWTYLWNLVLPALSMLIAFKGDRTGGAVRCATKNCAAWCTPAAKTPLPCGSTWASGSPPWRALGCKRR